MPNFNTDQFARDLGGAAYGDPHFITPLNSKFDFKGQVGGVYTLFSSPWYQMSMELKDNPGNPDGAHNIAKVGVLLGKEEFLFDSAISPNASSMATLEARLHDVGGKLLKWSAKRIEIELCLGHIMTIDYNLRSIYGYLLFLNFGMKTPWCHDSFGGALGQTYQCKYLVNPESFVWSPAQEESFRVATVFTPAGAFRPDSTCPAEVRRKMKFAKNAKMHQGIPRSLSGSVVSKEKPS